MYIATSQIIHIKQIWVFFATNHTGSWNFALLRNFEHLKLYFFLACFCLKNDKNSKDEQFLSHFGKTCLIALSNAHFLVLWKHSSQNYGHFGTFISKNGKTYNLAPVPHFELNFTFWFVNMLLSGHNLDTNCIWLSNASPSHEIIRKIYFVVKPSKKGLNRGCWNFKCPFFVTST